MRVTFAYDRRAKRIHYKIRHADIREEKFEEQFTKSMVVIGQEGRVLKAVGRTSSGRFLTTVFIRASYDHYHVITGWPSTRTQISLWHKEMKGR